MKPIWDDRFWELAKFVAQWSKDPDAKVGAVMVTKKGGAIALAYNGFPAKVEDDAERLQNKEIKLKTIIHAEQNALIIAGRSAEGCQLYVWGKPICPACAVLIIQSGISRVIAMDPIEVGESSKWYEPGKYAIDLFHEAGVKADFRKIES